MHPYRLTLDLQCFAQEKTERATPKKRQEERKKGTVAKSQEIPSAFILFFTFMFLLLYGTIFRDGFMSLFAVSFHEYILWDVTQTNVISIFGSLLFDGLLLLAPVFIITMAIAIIGNYVQIGFLFTGEPLKPKLNKLDPIQGAKRIFALRALIEFSKSVLKIIIIGIVVYVTISNRLDELLQLPNLPLSSIMSYAGQMTIIIALTVGGILIVLSILDYIYQKYDYEKRLRMSKQDIKDEHKKSEGDPLIKSRIRETQRKMAFSRMMSEIPTADVIVTNPTHYAIAIRYDDTQMDAPQVIAKGKDYIALKIKEKAKEYNIVMMENKPLARALYEQVEIGEAIPSELFQAVAEVLAYVYRLKRLV